MGFMRTGRLLAAIGVVAIMSLAAPVAAQAAEAEPTPAAESVATTSGWFVADPPPAQVNVPIHYQFRFNGDAMAIAASHVPAGLRVDFSGLLTGIPTVASSDSKILLSAYDWGSEQQIDQWVPLPVAEPERPVITNTLPPASADAEYLHQVHGTVPANTSVTYSASGLPDGYTISPGGVVSGAFDASPGRYDVAITATTQPQLPGMVPVSSSVTQTLVVAEPEKPVFIGALPPANFDETYTYQVQATAPADTSVTFAASGLPEGFSMTPDGLITGDRHAKLGSHPVTITATAHRLSPGRAPVTSSVTWPLAVEVERPVLTDPGLPATIHDRPYSYQVPATAPAARPVLSFTARGLPEGLSMTRDGLITGRAKAPKGGTFPVTVEITASADDRPSVVTSFTMPIEVRNSWWDELGSYHVILNDSNYMALPDNRIVGGDCPGGMYLDVRAGTDGRYVGQGFIVATDHWSTAFLRTGVLRYKTHPDGKAASGMDLRVTALDDPGVYVEMVCTSNPAYAWKG